MNISAKCTASLYDESMMYGYSMSGNSVMYGSNSSI